VDYPLFPFVSRETASGVSTFPLDLAGEPFFSIVTTQEELSLLRGTSSGGGRSDSVPFFFSDLELSNWSTQHASKDRRCSPLFSNNAIARYFDVSSRSFYRPFFLPFLPFFVPRQRDMNSVPLFFFLQCDRELKRIIYIFSPPPSFFFRRGRMTTFFFFPFLLARTTAIVMVKGQNQVFPLPHPSYRRSPFSVLSFLSVEALLMDC